MAAKKRHKRAPKKDWSRCGCPAGSKRISTRGAGRGWACQGQKPKRSRSGRVIKKPFVRAVCR